MKKIVAFLRSMTFGMILLLLIAACSVAGSLIPQQRAAMEYVSRYGAAAEWIIRLGLDDVFSAPYFILLMAALCLNLTLCSVIRVVRLRGAGDRLRHAAAASAREPATQTQVKALEGYLSRRGYKRTQQDGVTLYSKYVAGFYGSFLTHLALIVLLVVGAATIYGADVQDRTVMPGETLTLDGGTTIEVRAFQIEDETGRLDYASRIVMADGRGNQTPETVVRVNEPMRFGGYKVYQQTYGTAGAITVYNAQNGGSDTLTLTEPVFLTLDGVNGVYYNALYPGYTQAEDGSVTLVTSTSGAYHDPVYDLRVMAEGQTAAVLAFPGETISVGDVSFTLEAPVSYPGLRIKYLPGAILGALYASFAFIVAALYVCFFMRPVCVAVGADGYAIASPKPQLGLQLEIESLIKEDQTI